MFEPCRGQWLPPCLFDKRIKWDGGACDALSMVAGMQLIKYHLLIRQFYFHIQMAQINWSPHGIFKVNVSYNVVAIIWMSVPSGVILKTWSSGWHFWEVVKHLRNVTTWDLTRSLGMCLWMGEYEAAMSFLSLSTASKHKHLLLYILLPWGTCLISSPDKWVRPDPSEMWAKFNLYQESSQWIKIK